ncbi:beta-glucosidase [Mesotoga sp. B105.6.4]|uniref:beta-glucosidase family protein n=1 Tax=Mesotoga sp. B105.6.4 TaxID=1582224 RepID=UPI000CCC5908|nr:glycoside hydrolase [Mesotoga sp. B105.6.4]
MTLEEKISLVVGVGMLDRRDNPKGRVSGAAGETVEIERLKIPAASFADGPAGLRIHHDREGDTGKYHTTAFPVETMLASSWNRTMLRKVGEAMGREAREYGVDFLLAPAVNIHRNPLCGRNFEYYSEDPLLTAEMAAPFIEGVQSQGVGACIKHFVANEQETNRMTVDTVVSERALREIYLRPFEIAIRKAKPWTLMSSYNKLYGSYTSQSRWLLTEILREEWGFEGFVMTDWFAGDDAAKQIEAGNDLIMPGKSFQNSPQRKSECEEIRLAIESGDLDLDTLDERVKAILRILVRTPAFSGCEYSNSPDLEANAAISYEAGCEGVVLLKNESALPLSAGAPFVVFGTGQIETVRGGTGSGETHPAYTVSLLEGMEERGLAVDKEVAEFYRRKIEELRSADYSISYGVWNEEIRPRLPEDLFDEAALDELSNRNEAALVVISRISGEGRDRRLEEGDYYLTEDELKLIAGVSKAFRKRGKRVIGILNIGSPIEVESWAGLFDGILLLWQPGQEAGRILADVISGSVNPSGKLPTTFPRTYADVPSRSFPGEPADNPSVVSYDEGIYVGYRYYETFRVKPVFEFGFGLSYTDFEYSDPEIILEGEEVIISLIIKNTGSTAGKEVFQVYVKAPKGKIDKPRLELRGFGKTDLLQPGEEEKLTVRLSKEELASFDGYRWIVEQGEYEFLIGASSRDVRSTGKVRLRKTGGDLRWQIERK